MLTPNDIEALKDYTVEIMQPVIDFLLDDISRRVAKAGKITSTAEYQIYRAEALGASQKDIAKFLQQQNKLKSTAVSELLGFVKDKTIDFEDNDSLHRLMIAYEKTFNKDFENLLRTKNIGMIAPNGHVYPLQKTYMEAMDFAFKQTITGATDYNTAINRATDKLYKSGIKYIPQKNDRLIGIEYATRRFCMSNLGMVVEELGVMNHDELGCNGWELSAHGACAPDHEEYQGKQYTDKEYEELNNSLVRRIGTLNCGHMAFPIILGNTPAYSAAEIETMKRQNAEGVTYEGRHYTLYAAHGQQKALESRIREQKNKCIVSNAKGDAISLQQDQIKLGVMKAEYQRFSRGVGLPTAPERMRAAGFGRSEASKAQWTYRKSENGLDKIFSNQIEIKNDNNEFDINIANDNFIEKIRKLNTVQSSLIEGCYENLKYVDVTSYKKCPENFVMGYNERTKDICYNKENLTAFPFDYYIINVHELSHAVDDKYFKAYSQPDFAMAFQTAIAKMQEDNKYFQKVINNTDDDCLSDIFAALSENAVIKNTGHKPEYWKTPFNKEKEVFANIFSVEILRNEESLKILSDNFPELMNAFKNLKMR